MGRGAKLDFLFGRAAAKPSSLTLSIFKEVNFLRYQTKSEVALCWWLYGGYSHTRNSRRMEYLHQNSMQEEDECHKPFGKLVDLKFLVIIVESWTYVTAWQIFLDTLLRQTFSFYRGDPIPRTLIEKVDDYIPDDLTKLLNAFQVPPDPAIYFFLAHVTAIHVAYIQW